MRATLAEAAPLLNAAQAAASMVQAHVGAGSRAASMLARLVHTIGHLQAEIAAGMTLSDPVAFEHTLMKLMLRSDRSSKAKASGISGLPSPGGSQPQDSPGPATVDSQGYVGPGGQHLDTPEMWIAKWCSDGQQTPDPSGHTPKLICPTPGSPPIPPAPTVQLPKPQTAINSCCLGFPVVTSLEWVAGHATYQGRPSYIACFLATSADADGSGNPDNVVMGAEDGCGDSPNPHVRAFGQPIMYFNDTVHSNRYILEWGQPNGISFDNGCFCGGSPSAAGDYLGPAGSGTTYPKQVVDGTWLDIGDVGYGGQHWDYFGTDCAVGQTPDWLACYAPGATFYTIPDEASAIPIVEQYLQDALNQLTPLLGEAEALANQAVAELQAEVAYAQQEAGCAQSQISSGGTTPTNDPICQDAANGIQAGLQEKRDAQCTLQQLGANPPAPSQGQTVCQAAAPTLNTVHDAAASALADAACTAFQLSSNPPAPSAGQPICQATAPTLNTVHDAIAPVTSDAACTAQQLGSNPPSPSPGQTLCTAAAPTLNSTHSILASAVQTVTQTIAPIIVPILQEAESAVQAAVPPAASTAVYKHLHCSPKGVHAYGEACLYGSQFLGVDENIESSALTAASAPQGQQSFIDNDLWIVNPTAAGLRFIEAGLFSGSFCKNIIGPNRCQLVSGTSFVFFFGAQRTDNYYGHLFGSASPSTYYGDAIYEADSRDWVVNLGPYRYKLTNYPMRAGLIRTGTEKDSHAATACSQQSSLSWEDAGGIWHTGWSDSSQPGADRSQSKPPYAQWASPNNWLQDYSGESPSCFGSAPAPPPALLNPPDPVASSNAGPTGPAGAPSRTGANLTEAQISQIAHQFAAGMGDLEPSSIEHVASTRERAVYALSDDEVPGSEGVYVIVMRGHFIADNAPRPPGAPAPSGSTLTLVLNSSTGDLTDFGIGNQLPDLTSLGAVTKDQ